MPHTLQFHRCPDAQLHLLALHCNSLLVCSGPQAPWLTLVIFGAIAETYRGYFHPPGPHYSLPNPTVTLTLNLEGKP